MLPKSETSDFWLQSILFRKKAFDAKKMDHQKPSGVPEFWHFKGAQIGKHPICGGQARGVTLRGGASTGLISTGPRHWRAGMGRKGGGGPFSLTGRFDNRRNSGRRAIERTAERKARTNA